MKTQILCNSIRFFTIPLLRFHTLLAQSNLISSRVTGSFWLGPMIRAQVTTVSSKLDTERFGAREGREVYKSLEKAADKKVIKEVGIYLLNCATIAKDVEVHFNSGDWLLLIHLITQNLSGVSSGRLVERCLAGHNPLIFRRGAGVSHFQLVDGLEKLRSLENPEVREWIQLCV